MPFQDKPGIFRVSFCSLIMGLGSALSQIFAWSPVVFYERVFATTEEFTRMLGWRYVLNVYRVVCAITSVAGFVKPKYSLHRMVSVVQLIAVALTLVSLRHALYVYSVALQTFALGVATFSNNLQVAPQCLFCVLTNALAHMAWTTMKFKWPMNAMTQYEWQMRGLYTGCFIGAVELWQRAKLWYAELMSQQDTAERENARLVAEKKDE